MFRALQNAPQAPGIRRGCPFHVVLTTWARHPRRITSGPAGSGNATGATPAAGPPRNPGSPAWQAGPERATRQCRNPRPRRSLAGVWESIASATWPGAASRRRARLGWCAVSEGEVLAGDGVTPGIVRIGDTVRRPLRPFSLTVQAYLAHLREAGFTGAPVPLGVDGQGREVLSFVPGEVPRNPLPPETAGRGRAGRAGPADPRCTRRRPAGCRRAGPGVPPALGGRRQGRAAACRGVAAPDGPGDHRSPPPAGLDRPPAPSTVTSYAP